MQMKGSLTVRFLSGRQEQFEVDFWGGAGAEGRLQEFLKSPNVVLQTTTDLIILPTAAIESLIITLPKEEKARLGLDSIRVAKRVR
jgi:hypothetical protein